MELDIKLGRSRIAFQGERGAFSEDAIDLVMPDAQSVPRPSFRSLFRSIDEGVAEYILAPIENSLAGSVMQTYDLLLDSELWIKGEVQLRICHQLIGLSNAVLQEVHTVESHPVALAQCERFLELHPFITPIMASDTAGSVRTIIAAGDPTRAAIASERAARVFGASVLAPNIEDDSANYTRFVLLTRQRPSEISGNKLSLAMELSNRPGRLHEALGHFSRQGIDLLKIESRPIKGRPWHYRFYLDVRTSLEHAETALKQLKSSTEALHILGCYSEWPTPKDQV